MTDQLMLIPGLPEVPAPADGPHPAELARFLRRTRMRVGTEVALQASIEEALIAAGIAYEREARLGPADRIDFLVGAVGIEAKVKCGKRVIYRQLERYAAHSEIAGLILVTATALGLPPEIGGKPVFFVSTGRAAL